MKQSNKIKQQVRRQRMEQQQRRANTIQDGASSPCSIDDGPPHPYHVPIPRGYAGVSQRSASATSQMSDISMDEFSGNQESMFEYSDTSGEEREDAYFLPDSTTGGPPKSLLGDYMPSGESAFRDLRKDLGKSSRVVRFNGDPSGNSDFSPPTSFDSTEKKRPERIEPQMPAYRPSAAAPSPGPNLKSWVTNLAFSIRSPSVGGASNKTPDKHHRSMDSASVMEYPFTNMEPSKQPRGHSLSHMHTQGQHSWERTPLMQPESKDTESSLYGGEYAYSGKHPLSNGGDKEVTERAGNKQFTLKSKSTAAAVAAFFLMDYEAGRPPTLSENFETITQNQLRIYRFLYSSSWRLLGVNLAVLVTFLCHSLSPMVTAILHTYVIIIFFIEMWMKEQLYSEPVAEDQYHLERRLNRPLALFLLILGLESWVWFIFPPNPNAKAPFLVSSLFKPLMFFYVSIKARHAVEGLLRITKILARVLMIEMFLIMVFAGVACTLFHDYDNFRTLSRSWLSLFELSTTVVNPSLWMPMYASSASYAIFFVLFDIVSVFYLHSLVLSVVFQTFIHAASEIHDRSVAEREVAVHRAFLALLRDDNADYVSSHSVRKTLQLVRPHYSPMKIKALMDIVDPRDQHAIDYQTFRTRIRQALNASIRTTRSNSGFAMGIELIAALVAVVNCIYVILLTTDLSPAWFNSTTVLLGGVITFFGLFELIVRFNPTRIPNFAPITRLNPTFDGLALMGGLISAFGFLLYAVGIRGSVDYMLMGRAIDTIRIMRFSQIFRDVIRRSADVVPAMAGPILLVLTIIHIFVVLGMGLWGGAINTTKMALNEDLTPLYYLNNFNSYNQGLVTVFNILVVNDWHAIAQVFLFADRCSHPVIVYAFFITALCCAVFVMLNVITAFFVESFVTKIEESKHELGDEDMAKTTSKSEFSVHTGESSYVKHTAGTGDLKKMSEPEETDPILSADDQSLGSTASTEVFTTFDVYEREGFDQIMRTVAGGATAEEQEAFAKSVCDYLEIFESLSPGREKVGYMICCQQTMNRFGNRRFHNNSKDFVKSDILHKVVSDMHSELLVLSSRRKFGDRCLVRSFNHASDPSVKLEITGSVLRHQPAVSLLVSRIRPVSEATP
eukprot:Nitzschia sp. Nitz4//scaffold69_size99277//19473//23043//NITZ4_004622-RA/size99277-augustus-gene-0.1-mRNA-1//1//CDS//3329556682//7122//frame0